MGLPVWRVPSPEAKEAVKSDVTAPARSPIRRRSPFASRRARPARAGALQSPRALDSIDVLAQADHLAHLPPPEPLRRQRLPPPPVPESRHYVRPGDSAREAYRTVYEFGARRHAAITRNSRPLPAYTPNFGPAHAARNAPSETAFSTWTTFASADPTTRAGGDDTPTERFDDGSDHAVGLPPLRRMGRRSIADGPLPSSSLRESWSPAATLDGLGDRNRSISPDDDHWDTFLNTVAPDPQLPTADSSFTSAAASASFSGSSNPGSRAGSDNSNSAASSSTHLTVPSRHDMRACDTSDSDTASDTEAEDDDLNLFDYHRRLRERNNAQWVRRLRDDDRADAREARERAREARERAREARQLARGVLHSPRDSGLRSRQSSIPLLDQMDGPAEAPSNGEDAQGLMEELRNAHVYLERLAQRGDISDEIWASVGLTRSMADGVERIQQRERSN